MNDKALGTARISHMTSVKEKKNYAAIFKGNISIFLLKKLFAFFSLTQLKFFIQIYEIKKI